MALIEREEALSILSGHLDAFYQVVSGAWGDYMSYPNEKRVVHSGRSRASLVHDHMVDRASRYAVEGMGVQIVEKRKLYLFVFDGRIAVRFKKFDEELKTCNQPTNQVWQFKSQIQLPGVEAVHNLESGYILGADEQSIQAIHLVCPSGSGVYWDVLLTENAQFTVVEDLFAKKIASEEDEEGAIVKRREEAKIIQLKKNDDQS